ncbi:MAG: hypothetical protein LBS19_14505, partial [Clostridiales bacterium]|nr:hypothetical protein [Clostridiales bacterium]
MDDLQVFMRVTEYFQYTGTAAEPAFAAASIAARYDIQRFVVLDKNRPFLSFVLRRPRDFAGAATKMSSAMLVQAAPTAPNAVRRSLLHSAQS